MLLFVPFCARLSSCNWCLSSCSLLPSCGPLGVVVWNPHTRATSCITACIFGPSNMAMRRMSCHFYHRFLCFSLGPSHPGRQLHSLFNFSIFLRLSTQNTFTMAISGP